MSRGTKSAMRAFPSMTQDVRIGISGWTYTPWRGQFYPEGLPQKKELAYAASVFTPHRDQRHVLLDAALLKTSPLGGCHA